jgi:hypothetical protein
LLGNGGYFTAANGGFRVALRADLVTAWDVVRAAFGDHDVPGTLMGFTVHGYRNQLVEIDTVAPSSAEVGMPPSSATAVIGVAYRLDEGRAQLVSAFGGL